MFPLGRPAVAQRLAGGPTRILLLADADPELEAGSRRTSARGEGGGQARIRDRDSTFGVEQRCLDPVSLVAASPLRAQCAQGQPAVGAKPACDRAQ